MKENLSDGTFLSCKGHPFKVPRQDGEMGSKN